MKITNKFNLPDVFVRAVSMFEGDYDRGDSDHTATELIRPPRISALMRKHWDEITEDVSERVWALQGQVGHLIFERVAQNDPSGMYFAEHRAYATIDGKKISGRIDLLDRSDNTLWDYKNSSVWKFMLGDTREWEEQLNINAYCARAEGYHVDALKVLCLIKDWKPRDAAKRAEDGYPQYAVHIVNIPMWSNKECENFIAKRSAAVDEAHTAIAAGKEPVLCTSDERWESEEKWAVMKLGRKSAIKLYDAADKQRAQIHVTQEKGGYLEHRPGEPRRCLSYCAVAQFCNFGRRALGLDADGNTAGPPT